MNKGNHSRDEKIKKLVGLITGELSLKDVRAKRTILCIQWDDDLEADDNIYLIDGKKVNYQTYLKAIS